MNPKARHRAALILQVRSGQMTATAAAQALGISRQLLRYKMNKYRIERDDFQR